MKISLSQIRIFESQYILDDIFEAIKIYHLKHFYFAKKRPQRRHFLKIFKLNLFPTGLCYGIDSWHILRQSGTISKKYNFATLGQLRMKL